MRLLRLAPIGLICGLACACSGAPVPTQTLEVLSQVYVVDREYRSMMGPSSVQELEFPYADPPELVWITGYKAVMVGADGESEMPQEFMCHSNLDFDATEHAALMNLPVYHTGRLFTLSQGQQEIRFPSGFGLPYFTDETLDLTTQVLNLNYDGTPHEVRHKVTLEYVYDRDLDEPMKPLFMTSGWGLVTLDGESAHWNVAEPSPDLHGEGCLPGEAASGDLREDAGGRRFSGHWVVPPGRQVNRTNVTRIMSLPYDTTIHYAAVHLHPFAESVELRDLTSGRSVLEAEVHGYDDKIGIDRVQEFSSAEGIPLAADHEYELVSVYDNTTDRDQDSMSVMLLYLHDKQWTKVERRSVRRVSGSPRLSDERLILHTNHGEIEIGLYPDVSPKHVERVLEMARLGVYDTTHFFRVVPGFLAQTSFPHVRSGSSLTDEQRASIRRIPAEFSTLPHVRGTVSMVLNDNRDADSAEASFSILLGEAPHLDGRYTVIGRVTRGIETLDEIEAVPIRATAPVERVEIERAEVTSG